MASKSYWSNQMDLYQGKVNWCKTNSSQWSQKASGYQGELDKLNEQMKIAKDVKSKCDDLEPSNQDVIDALNSLGKEAAARTECDSCNSAAEKIAQPNAGHVTDAIKAAQSVIDRLQEQIDSTTDLLHTAQDNVSYFDRCAQQYQSSYDDATKNYNDAED